MLEKTPESPLGCMEIKPVNSTGNQPCIFIGRTDAEALIRWPPDENSWLFRKDPDAGKDWRQEEKGVTEDEIVEWHHQVKGHEFEQAPDMVKDREAWCAGVHGVKKVRHDWATEQQSTWYFSGYFHNVERFSIAVCWDQIKELFLSKKSLGKNKVTYPFKKERLERCSFCSPVFPKTVNNAQEGDFLLFWKGNWYYLNSISFVYCPVNMFASWA